MNSAEPPLGPAEVYDKLFVPALFAQWGPVLIRAAGAKWGERVLDVACGTGALTLAAAERVGPSGSAVGLDANPDMLAVARRKSATIGWVEGRAEALPLSDRTFDVVLSQFALMFFGDPALALREMARVLPPGGRMAVAVCDAVEESPGYAAFASLLDGLFGTTVGDSFRAPFALGDPEKLRAIAKKAGIKDARLAQRRGVVRFDSVAAMVSTERACAWTLGGVLNEEQFARLVEEAESALKPFVSPDGAVSFDMPALILTASKS